MYKPNPKDIQLGFQNKLNKLRFQNTSMLKRIKYILIPPIQQKSYIFDTTKELYSLTIVNHRSLASSNILATSRKEPMH